MNTIAEVVSGYKWLTLEEQEECMRYEHGESLIIGRQIDDKMGRRLARIKKPNVALNLSNALVYGLETRCNEQRIAYETVVLYEENKWYHFQEMLLQIYELIRLIVQE